MPGLKMSAMNVGPISCAKNLIVAFAPGNVDVPTTSVIIEHPKHGLVLWDTGINDAVADPERADAYWGPGVRAAFGTQRFTPEAVHVVQRDEIRYAMWPDPWTRPVYCQNDYRDIRKLNILELDGDFDPFNDGTLKLVKTPGHAPGHQVLIVDLPNRGRVCLAADTGHQRDGFDNMVPMPWDWSTSAMSVTRMRMKQLERSGIPLFFCHDAGDFAKLPQGGQFWD